MNKYYHESITTMYHGRKVTLSRRTLITQTRTTRQVEDFWIDPYTGDVYDVDLETGKVTLIYNTTK